MRLSLLALLILGCSTSEGGEPVDAFAPEAEVNCSIDDRTIRCDRRFDPGIDAADAFEHTALHLVLAEPLDGPLAFEGTMDFVQVLFHQVWAREPSDPGIEGFDPPGIFTEAQFLRAGIGDATARIEVSGGLTPAEDGCVDLELGVLSEIAGTHGWSATACPR